MSANPGVAGLPKIIRFEGATDAGEFGSASCPHCGAPGRYIHHFLTERGRGGAMAGCLKLFPVSRVALEEKRLRQKDAEYKEKGWRGLNELDARALETINRFYLGQASEQDAMHAVELAKTANTARFRNRRSR